jgi:hypothetical protein
MNPTSSNRKDEIRYRIDRIKDAINLENLLNSLGFTISSSNSKELRAACKIHGGDNKTAFRVNKITKTWSCFSHHCEESIGFDIISLVKYMLNFDFMETIVYLENICGINIYDGDSYDEYKRINERRSFINKTLKEEIEVSPLVNEEYLSVFKKFRSNFFIEQGYTKEVLDVFDIGGGYIDKFGIERDVIPIRDKDSKLVGYSYRSISNDTSYDHKYIIEKGFKKD